MQGTINTGMNPAKTVEPGDKRLSRTSPHKNSSRKKAIIAKQTHTDDNVLIVDALAEELYQSRCRKRTYSLEQNISDRWLSTEKKVYAGTISSTSLKESSHSYMPLRVSDL